MKSNKVSIIIKALNEERHIAKCIESSIEAIKQVGGGEVILVDSISTDKTVEIAMRYPIKIIQLKHKWMRRCGVGPQIGYLYSRYDYIYVLDGDMTIDKYFLKKAMPYLDNPEVAGVGGIIEEQTLSNILFRKRKRYANVEKVSEVKLLEMGGLYKRSVIEKVGYLTNPYLYSYEEADFGYRATTIGYKFLRLNVPGVKHWGKSGSSFKIMIDKFKSKYLMGAGQVLRYNLGTKAFWLHFKALKIYLWIIFWWLFGIISLALSFINDVFIKAYIALTTVGLAILFIKKKKVSEFAFSMFSWNITALALLIGFFMKKKDPLKYPVNVKIIKK